MSYTRRKFLQYAGVSAVGGVLASHTVLGADLLSANNSNTLRVGLVGCGGRGTAAAVEALNADPNVVLTAMGDAFEDHLSTSFQTLSTKMGKKVQVPSGSRFVGLDAYQKVIGSDVDVVILAAPPAFRPAHLEAAVSAGKHIFCEKPFAVDGPGLRRVIAAAQKAKVSGLALVAGFCWRYHQPKRETFGKVLNGQIGNILTAESTYNTGELWYKEREPGWSDFEYQLRNWLYYNWLSGDHIVEQAIHSMDMMQWALGDRLPLRVTASGGRQKRTDARFGNVYDHFSAVYEYGDGTKSYFSCRQQNGTSPSYAVELFGDRGRCLVDCRTGEHIITGQTPWKYSDDTKFTDDKSYEKKTASRGMYQQEHDELFASIRKGSPRYDGDWMVKANLMALAGRDAGYSGQTVVLDDVLRSERVLFPAHVSWDMKYDIPVAVPGSSILK